MRSKVVKVLHIPSGLKAQADMRSHYQSKLAAIRHIRGQLEAPVPRPLELVRSYTNDLEDDDFDEAADARLAEILNSSPEEGAR